MTSPGDVQASQSDVHSPAPRGDDGLLIGRLLEAGVSRAPEQVIVGPDGERLTYRAFGERVRRLASGLRALGITEGRTVAVMAWDSPRYLELYFAVPMLGAVLHTINVRLPSEQIAYTINHARDDLIVVDAEFLPMLERIQGDLDHGKRLVVVEQGELSATSLHIAARYERMLEDAAPEFEFPRVDENSRATLFYTSGTTGLPKGVHFTHRQLALHTLALGSVLGGGGQGGLGEAEVYMPITPMFHVHAWGMPYVAIMLGLKHVYPGRYRSERLVDLIVSEGVTLSHCVPTILQSLLQQARSTHVRLDHWRVVVGGAALSQALAAEAMALGADVYAGYGMSESGPLLTLGQLSPQLRALPAGDQLAWRCKAGRPVPFVSIRIVDAAMKEVARGTPGEIVVRAPWLTSGYLGDDVSSERLWTGGWMHTGDIGFIDDAGWLNVTDRLKDVIKTGGEWVSSLTLEELIARYMGVGEVAVIGVPDPKWTERPLAVIVARAGVALDAEALRTHLAGLAGSGAISRYAIPERIEFVDSLPKTGTGKIDKKQLRARYVEP